MVDPTVVDPTDDDPIEHDPIEHDPIEDAPIAHDQTGVGNADPKTMPAETLPGEASSPAGASEEAGRSETSGLGPARITSIVVGLVVASLIVLFAFGRDSVVDQGSALLGARAQPVAGEVLGGGTFDIDDHRGSWVLVNFFATWCPPCVAEHPDLVELESWGSERGDLQLVSVVFNDPPSAVQRFFDERGGNWPVIDNPTVAIDYQVSQIPESFLISPAGQVVLHIEGQLAASEVQRIIEERN